MVAYWFCVDLVPSKKLFCFFNALMFCTFAALYTNYLCAPWELADELGPFSIKSSLVCLGLDLILMTAFYRTFHNRLPFLLEDERLDEVWKILMFVPVALATLLHWMVPMSPSVVMVGRVRPVALVAMALVPLAIYLLYNTFWYSSVLYSESFRLQQENALYRMERKRYEQLRAYLNNTRTLRHDFRQHILVLDRLARSGEMKKLTEYLQQFTQAVENGQQRYCANTAIDAVAASYAGRAKDQDTVVNWHLDLPEELPVREADLCGILGNLMENALRAVSELPQERRRVRVISRMLSQQMLGLSVENPYEGTVKLNKKGLPKAKRSDHGLGMASVAAAVQRYKGTLDIQTERGVFVVNLLLFAQDPPAEQSTAPQE